VTITRTNFTGADLSGASLFDIAAYSTTEFPRPDESPNFEGADLSGINIQARLTGVNMRGADLSDARLGVRREQLKSPIWHDLSGCDLTGADLSGADLDGAILRDVKGLSETNGLGDAKNQDKAIY
jgi:uncharacterized protein YjbI with pentapeptide repeats